MNLSSSLTHSIFKTVGQVADTAKVRVFVVGGFVRDILLKRSSKDIDFVCVGSGIELAEKVASALGARVHVYKNFGTAQIPMEGLDVEFVGARKE
jgi:tRNA nucleotidyltransferase/poly(A) polymerase